MLIASGIESFELPEYGFEYIEKIAGSCNAEIAKAVNAYSAKVEGALGEAMILNVSLLEQSACGLAHASRLADCADGTPAGFLMFHYRTTRSERVVRVLMF